MNQDRLKAIKDSIVVIVDSREQRNLHLLSRLSEKGVKFMVSAMKYGDYSFFIPIYDPVKGFMEIDFKDKVVIERKAHITEISNNFTKGRIQFDTEFQKAKTDGCKVHLIIEDPKGRDKIKHRQELDKAACKDWDFIFRKTWRSQFCANSMIGSLKAFKERYNLEVIFCKKTETADKMLEIFYKAIDTYFNSEKE